VSPKASYSTTLDVRFRFIFKFQREAQKFTREGAPKKRIVASEAQSHILNSSGPRHLVYSVMCPKLGIIGEFELMIFKKSEPDQTSKVISLQERWQKGKALRAEIPWKSHACCERAKSSQDPITLVQEHDRGRLCFLLPIKYGRMAASPLAFLRGSAAIMAADLSNTPVTGIKAMLCGDAHLLNFGIFASPERRVIFDVDDFDEC